MANPSHPCLPKEGKVSIGISFATDPYQPAEETYQLTLRSLEIAKEVWIACEAQRQRLIISDTVGDQFRQAAGAQQAR